MAGDLRAEAKFITKSRSLELLPVEKRCTPLVTDQAAAKMEEKNLAMHQPRQIKNIKI